MLGEITSSTCQGVRADLVCVLCDRTAAKVQGPNLRAITRLLLPAQNPQHLEAVRRLRCPHCSGRLLLQNNAEVDMDRFPLETEKPRPSKGRSHNGPEEHKNQPQLAPRAEQHVPNQAETIAMAACVACDMTAPKFYAIPDRHRLNDRAPKTACFFCYLRICGTRPKRAELTEDLRS